jgi:hypothetical protein
MVRNMSGYGGLEVHIASIDTEAHTYIYKHRETIAVMMTI